MSATTDNSQGSTRRPTGANTQRRQRTGPRGPVRKVQPEENPFHADPPPAARRTRRPVVRKAEPEENPFHTDPPRRSRPARPAPVDENPFPPEPPRPARRTTRRAVNKQAPLEENPFHADLFRPARRVSDADIAEAKLQIGRAFQLCGLVQSDGVLVCPQCGEAKKGKVKLRDTGAFTHYGCHASDKSGSGDNYAVELVMSKMGYDRKKDFVHVVELLLGRATTSRTGKPVPVGPAPVAAPKFEAVVDTEVYHAVRDAGSIAEAIAFYGRFHISADAVKEADVRVVSDPDALLRELLARFGRERLVNCGLIKAPDDEAGKDFFMITKNYPVVEPHRLPDGTWVGMQFRASVETERRVKAYPADKAEYERRAAEWAEKHPDRPYPGVKPRYRPKFLSLTGGVVGQHLIGMGLPGLTATRVANVYIVEGAKDMMAARTMGPAAYAIPGTGVMPPQVAMDAFLAAGKTAMVNTDGDDAGEHGAELLGEAFKAAGVPFRRQKLPAGMDVTDILVGRHARKGCACEQCDTWRAKFGAS